MVRRVEALTLDGAAGALEARVDWPAGPYHGTALLCHPHPQHGGSMHTKALHRAGRGLVAAGFITLRFNFRGVGRSAGGWTGGAGELDDARVAWAKAVALHDGGARILGGFSFGAWIALQLGRAPEPALTPHALCAIAPPLGMYDFDFMVGSELPLLLVAGDADPHCPQPALADLASQIGPRAQVAVLPGARHLLLESLDGLERTVRDFAITTAANVQRAP